MTREEIKRAETVLMDKLESLSKESRTLKNCVAIVLIVKALDKVANIKPERTQSVPDIFGRTSTVAGGTAAATEDIEKKHTITVTMDGREIAKTVAAVLNEEIKTKKGSPIILRMEDLQKDD